MTFFEDIILTLCKSSKQWSVDDLTKIQKLIELVKFTRK